MACALLPGGSARSTSCAACHTSSASRRLHSCAVGRAAGGGGQGVLQQGNQQVAPAGGRPQPGTCATTVPAGWQPALCRSFPPERRSPPGAPPPAAAAPGSGHSQAAPPRLRGRGRHGDAAARQVGSGGWWAGFGGEGATHARPCTYTTNLSCHCRPGAGAAVLTGPLQVFKVLPHRLHRRQRQPVPLKLLRHVIIHGGQQARVALLLLAHCGGRRASRGGGVTTRAAAAAGCVPGCERCGRRGGEGALRGQVPRKAAAPTRDLGLEVGAHVWDVDAAAHNMHPAGRASMRQGAGTGRRRAGNRATPAGGGGARRWQDPIRGLTCAAPPPRPCPQWRALRHQWLHPGLPAAVGRRRRRWRRLRGAATDTRSGCPEEPCSNARLGWG